MSNGFYFSSDEMNLLFDMPHAPRLVYLYLRQKMDKITRIVGVKPKISYQSISEFLSVTPKSGRQRKEEFKPTLDQMRWYIEVIEKQGLIKKIPAEKQLIFALIHAVYPKLAQNEEPQRNPSQEPQYAPQYEPQSGGCLNSIKNNKLNIYNGEEPQHEHQQECHTQNAEEPHTPSTKGKPKPSTTSLRSVVAPPFFPQTEIESKKKCGSTLKADWVLPSEWGEWAMSENPGWSASAALSVAEQFKDYWLANANQKNGKKADWFATWRNWVRRENKQVVSSKKQTTYNATQSRVNDYYEQAEKLRSRLDNPSFDEAFLERECIDVKQ